MADGYAGVIGKYGFVPGCICSQCVQVQGEIEASMKAKAAKSKTVNEPYAGYWAIRCPCGQQFYDVNVEETHCLVCRDKPEVMAKKAKAKKAAQANRPGTVRREHRADRVVVVELLGERALSRDERDAAYNENWIDGGECSHVVLDAVTRASAKLRCPDCVPPRGDVSGAGVDLPVMDGVDLASMDDSGFTAVVHTAIPIMPGTKIHFNLDPGSLGKPEKIEKLVEDWGNPKWKLISSWDDDPIPIVANNTGPTFPEPKPCSHKWTDRVKVTTPAGGWQDRCGNCMAVLP